MSSALNAILLLTLGASATGSTGCVRWGFSAQQKDTHPIDGPRDSAVRDHRTHDAARDVARDVARDRSSSDVAGDSVAHDMARDVGARRDVARDVSARRDMARDSWSPDSWSPDSWSPDSWSPDTALPPDTSTAPPVFESYALTRGTYANTANLDQAVKQEFGAAATVADWVDIKAKFTGRSQTFLDGIGLLGWDSEAMLVSGGVANYSGGRHYFMARHDGTLKSGFLVHDNIDNNSIDLGSWSSITMRVLVKVE